MKKILVISLLCILKSAFYASANTHEVAKNYELAIEAYSAKKTNEAFIHLKNALQHDPRHLPSKILLSKVYFDAGNMEAVEDELKDALMLGADINPILPVLGNSLIIRRKADDLLALKKYRPQFSKNTEFEWYLLSGQAFLIKDDEIMAQMFFEKAQALVPDNVRGMNTLASLYLNLGWLDKAQQLVNQSLEIEPDNERTWALRGDLAIAQGRTSFALASYKNAHYINQNDPRVMRGLAGLYLRSGDYDKAGSLVERILKQSPGDPKAILIQAWLRAGEDQQAFGGQLSDLSMRLSVLEDKDVIHDQYLLFVKGASEYLLGHFEKARRYLENYLRARPSDVEAARILSSTYIQLGDTVSAIALLESKLRYFGKDIGLHLLLTQLYLQDKKLLAAEQTIERVKPVLTENHPAIVYLEAKTESIRGRTDQALARINKAGLSEAPLPITLLKGELQLQLGQVEQALKTAKNFVRNNVEDTSVLNFVTAVYLKNQQLNMAKRVNNQALKLNPEDLATKFNQAIILKAENNLADAQIVLNEILAEDSQHIPALLLKGRIEHQLGETDKALSLANTALTFEPGNVLALGLKLNIYSDLKDWQGALGVLSKLNSQDRLNPGYIVAKVRVLTEMQRYADIPRYLNILATLWQDEPARLWQLSELQTNANQIADGLDTLKKAISLDPDNVELNYALARRYQQLDQHQAAYELANTMLKKFGMSASLAVLMGDLAAGKQRYEEARTKYKTALRLDARNHFAYIGLYQLAQKNIGTKEFVSMLESKIEQSGSPAWMRKLLADSLLNQGKWFRAKTHYEVLLTHANLKNHSGILNNLANIYSRTDLDKALVVAKRALAQDPRKPALLDTVGWIYARQGQFNKALGYLRDAHSMNSDNPEIRYHIGYTLLKMNREQEAMAELRAAVAAADSFPEYATAKALLASVKL